MASQSPFESLSPELFENILYNLDAPRDVSSLCLASRAIYEQAIPKLYQSWTYYGLKHSPESLRTFLRTMVWRPDLAAHVRTLDIREWGRCPRLEEQQECPWRTEMPKKVEGSEVEIIEEIDYNEEEDQDFEDSDAQSDDSDDSDDGSESDTQDMLQEELAQLVIDQETDVINVFLSSFGARQRRNEIRRHLETVIECCQLEEGSERFTFLQTTAIHAGFERDTFVIHHASVHTKRENEDVLIAHLLASLPNLRQLFVVFPEPKWEDHGTAIQRMLVNSFESGENKILSSLESLYICSALHIGAKGHREYELELEHLLPFLRLKSIRSVQTLRAHTFKDLANTPPLEFGPFTQISNITSLALDEADLVPRDAINTLSVPKALESLRWSQELSCGTFHSCWAPFHNLIGKALGRHKSSLKNLDLDIRHRYCKQSGHAANPNANANVSLPYHIWNSEVEGSIRPPRDALLIGPLNDFTALKTLSIDATALCGHQHWVPSPIQLVDSLPLGLETLNLRVKLDLHEEIQDEDYKPQTEFNNTLWLSHLTNLVQHADTKLPSLKNIGILVQGRHWIEEYETFSFTEIIEGCLQVGLQLTIKNEPFGTEVPYFMEQTKNWYPGRDIWRHYHESR